MLLLSIIAFELILHLKIVISTVLTVIAALLIVVKRVDLIVAALITIIISYSFLSFLLTNT